MVVTRAVATQEIVTRRAKEGPTGGLRRGSGELVEMKSSGSNEGKMLTRARLEASLGIPV